ncbi:Holliday junction branch migration protein RuvA [Prochlorococcus marinus XMU1410]|uniref:Holliday junction branch migration protein RuvA n=1 Tax=Prochlorococcus marinus TaxID=1219 RepID=UPI001ADB2538|nr:Holliday junction branch migration protein RuvA [Prochlorococcus marinus]MBO8241885.1 Holliday junction branch migration protein RuvA [Prochlorococcus marinus XMU1410]MBW3053055.1 Holliday junction branch migration protein RuvA [Prochlorococcus marinus str. MU1410]
MISWISGDLVDFWQTNQKFFVLINCQGLGYEIQILESFFLKLKKNQISNKNITLWIKHIKKEDSDLLFGFTSKEQKNFFIEILSIRGVGSQISMAILNKFSINEVINAIKTQNKKLICSVPGIGQKMSDRLILELKSKLKSKFKSEILFEEEKSKDELEIKDPEIIKLMEDLQLTLQSLNYKNKEIKTILPIIIKEIDFFAKKENNLSFENLLKLAMNYLDKDSSNLAR